MREEDRFSPQTITQLRIEFAVSLCGVVNMCVVCVCVCVRARVCSVQFALRTRTKEMAETKVGSLYHFFILYPLLFKNTKTSQNAAPLEIPTNVHIIKHFPTQFTVHESSLTCSKPVNNT
jgi:hypothetical protein